MSSVGTHALFIGVAALVAMAVLVSSLGVPFTGPGGPVPSGPTSASVMSVDGLRLSLQISTAKDSVGGSVLINVSETNTNPLPLNESAARDWAIAGLRMDICYASIYPFGVAVYPGHYTELNVSSAAHLNLYPVAACPLLIRYISGYYFQPSSNVAVVMPGTGPGVPMASGVAAVGNFTSGNNVSYFTRGSYTVVAGDEWGALAFLYFSVV